MRSWRVAGASTIGTRHVAGGGVCEDALAVRPVTTPAGPGLALVAADGAGSSACAATGSKQAARHVADAGARRIARPGPPDEGELRDMVEAARCHLARMAGFHGRSLSDFSTTLLAAILAPDWAAFLQIGDGAIVVADPDEQGRWCWMFEPHKGAYANETLFLTQQDARARVQVAVHAAVPEELALFTDGLERLLIQEGPTRSVVDGFFNTMLRPVRAVERPGPDKALSRALAAYLAGEAINSRTDDDKTLILATRLAPVPAAAAEGDADAGHQRTLHPAD